MNILEFFKRYPDEEACKAKFLETRMAKGVVCPVCGSIEYSENIINFFADEIECLGIIGGNNQLLYELRIISQYFRNFS